MGRADPGRGPHRSRPAGVQDGDEAVRLPVLTASGSRFGRGAAPQTTCSPDPGSSLTSRRLSRLNQSFADGAGNPNVPETPLPCPFSSST